METFELSLRPNQRQILEYTGGRMGIAAVPGSGKTWTLSLLAAEIIARGVLAENQEVLIVTLVNSAVDNFTSRIRFFLKEQYAEKRLFPYMGYRVRTLHGLAHDIVRERPDLVGLSDDFQIIDERAADAVRNDVAHTWLSSHPHALDDYLDPEMEESKRDWIRRDRLPDLVQDIALSFVRSAKNQRLTPEDLRARLERLPVPLPLAEMGCDIYEDYQRALAYRGAVDFDDLIRLALQALEADEAYLQRLRKQWPYILEDEAQDSSLLQEQILSKLAGEGGNWVRVGDPNQAIYETFTTANPKYLREFLRDPFVTTRSLPHSGRSSPSIIELANELVRWTQTEHPQPEVQDALQGPPYIEATPPGDPQPNPPADPRKIVLAGNKFTPQEEIRAVADSLERWLPENPEATVAVLAPRNQRGFELADELRNRKIEVVDSLLRSSGTTRYSAGALGNVLNYLANPGSASHLARVYRVWRRNERDEQTARALLDRTAELLRKCPRVEDFVWPEPGRDWLAEIDLQAADPEMYERLVEFRGYVRRWQQATLLPVDQIVLTLSQELFGEPTELAVAHKLAVMLRHASQDNPAWRLPELTNELAVIARNERRFLGFSEDDLGFDPDRYRGKVVIATMHKAKGLEWDRVYLMAVNNYNFPSGMPYDRYMPEKWFLREKINLEAETLEQLRLGLSSEDYDWYEEGVATRQAQFDYVRERLRLLYVGLTRARKELIVSWNSGRKGDLGPASPFTALQSYWETNHGPAG